MQAPAASAVGSTELLERDRELEALAESLAAVRDSSRGRLTFVGGEAGVGKTALVRKLCDERRGAARILWGSCDPLFTPRPLGALIDLARMTGGDLEELVQSDVRPHEVAAALMRDLQAHAVTIVVIEDVHWADEATLDVLRVVGRRVDAVPALVVATYRDDQLDHANPLRIVLGELTDEPVRRVRLAPLSPAAVARLAEPHDGVDADELYRTTAGNPFFVTEVLAAGEEEIPQTIRDAVLARAARLSGVARGLLEAVAVVPPQAELWLLNILVGDGVERLEECLGSGMLTSEPQGVAFRHELARLAVEESIAPNRRIELHKQVLAALVVAPSDADLARLAHHAEAAGDTEAVLRYAPAAAERAVSLAAHREAAAQYARALRFGDRLSVAERADLLERFSRECYVIDQYDEGIAALEQALECRRTLGDRLKEGDALRRLSEFLWCPGRTAEAERSARAAVELLEDLPPGRELALAYNNLAGVCSAAMRSKEAIAWGGRALDLAESLDDTEIAVHALATIGVCQEDYEKLEQSLERARRAGLVEEVARSFMLLSATGVSSRRHSVANMYVEPGIAYCREQGLELFRLYLLAYRARLELDQGRWSEAADSAASVLRIPRTSTTPRIIALVVLALVRARRGDPEVWPLLDEAWVLAEPTGELPRLGPVSAARAEAAWLAGRQDVAETEASFELVLRRRDPWLAGELACWRRRLGVCEPVSVKLAEPYALELAGECEAAARVWAGLGCPYEAALALAHADEQEPLGRALDELNRLGAQPAAAIVGRRLRERGARGVPRGPRPATRENPAGLTARQLEVLALVAGGLRNAEIAERLFLSEKTVDHHVSAILRKLDVRTRAQASADAVRLGLVAQDR